MQIHYHGGPADGHCHAKPPQPPASIALPVSAGLFRYMHGGRLVEGIITSLAVYDLDGDTYRFRKSITYDPVKHQRAAGG